MSNLIKGNYKTKNIIDNDENNEEEETLESEFEKAALKELGGSIAYVSRKRVLLSKEEALQNTDNKEEKELLKDEHGFDKTENN